MSYFFDYRYRNLPNNRASRIYGEWGFIITHKSEWGVMGIYGYE